MTTPSVDLGHPTPSHGNIPAFRSIEEEADFWDPHDVTDFIDDTPVVTVTTGSDPERRDE